MTDAELVDFLLNASQTQERVLLLVRGELYEGHIESCLLGTVVAVARRYESGDDFTEFDWPFMALDDVARAEVDDPTEADVTGPDDPLLDLARKLRSDADMSIAEQMVQRRLHVSPADDKGATPKHDETPAPKPEKPTNSPESVPTPPPEPGQDVGENW